MAGDPPYTPQQALAIARKCLEEHSYRPCFHLDPQGIKRGFDNEDCFHVIESSGKINKDPEYDPDYDNWTYKIEGAAIDGDALTVVIAIEDRNGDFVTIITAYE